ncbi:MAG: flagellar motor switch protein FliN [Candidatus Hydrogenedentes bacterium]|nr:flagellar motor switch protein FliN [Candidatus Hydrogenedentota bacterium]
MGSSSTVPAQHLDMADIRDVRLGLSADLGTCTMPVRDVLALKRGSVVALNKTAGEMTEIYVNGRLLARGEVVVINDNLHVRIAEVFGVTETTDE